MAKCPFEPKLVLTQNALAAEVSRVAAEREGLVSSHAVWLLFWAACRGDADGRAARWEELVAVGYMYPRGFNLRDAYSELIECGSSYPNQNAATRLGV